MAQATKYTAEDIKVLEGLEPVRKRPGMYIGGVGKRRLHHLVWEIVDNSVDEAMNGHASTHRGHARTRTASASPSSDNGRGIPVDMHPEVQEERARGDLHDAARRRQVRAAATTSVSGGLHGVGASVVNALSKELDGDASSATAHEHEQTLHARHADRRR